MNIFNILCYGEFITTIGLAIAMIIFFIKNK